MVGQIAKQVFDCTVVGSAGGPDKCEYVCEAFGFDHCVDYKTCNSTKDMVQSRCLVRIYMPAIDRSLSLLADYGPAEGRP